MRAVAVLALTALIASCAGQEPVAREATTVADVCTHVDAPMMDIPTDEDSEPRLRIPSPPGWERSTEIDGFSESIRFALTDATVGADGRRNLAIVRLELVPAAGGDADAQTILDHLRVALRERLGDEGMPTNVTSTTATVCGLPAQRLTRPGNAVGLGASNTPEGRPITALQVVTKTGGQTYIASVMTNAAPDNSQDQREAELILSGFQVLPPTAITG